MTPRRGAVAVVREAFSRFRGDDMTDSAAALTYYALLSLFPALLVGASMFGLLGQTHAIDEITRYLSNHGADSSTVDAVRSSLRTAQSSRGGAGIGLVIGIALSIYGASGAFAAAGRALNRVMRVDEGRGIVRRKALDLACTLVVIVLAVVALLLVFLGGGVARQLFGELGLGATAADVWNVLRWPAAVVVAMTAFAFVYWTAPDRRGAQFRLISAGAAVAVAIWLAASAGFFVYVANFGSYNATYGAFAGAVILLVWLWLTNVALLYGAEIDAVRAEVSQAVDRPSSAPRGASRAQPARGTPGTASGAGGP
ncbi:MAG TPA: YihY/virulence factor BrkB family protein [Solirubrobacteraceae bacterium]|nr:YihY/virulence factor BrkB family protein [Solirubrobacteraceae bacterium]